MINPVRMASPVRVYFTLAFGLTWGIGGIGLLAGLGMPDWHPLSTSSPLYYLAGYSVSLTGIALTAGYGGRDGLRWLMQRLIPWRSAARWYLMVLVGYAAMAAIAWETATGFASGPERITWPFFLHGLWPAIANLAKDPGPLGEEFGWRGFALPRLLERYSPLRSSLLLGLLHAVWHLPLFLIPGMPQKQLSFPLFALGVIAIAIFDTAFYLRTEANLLLAILVHGMSNLCGMAVGSHALPFFFAAEAVAATVVVIAGGLRPAPKAAGGARDSTGV